MGRGRRTRGATMRPHISEAGRLHRLRPEQLQHELDLAREVQQSLLPSPLPRMSGVQMAAVNSPARVVSGDLYDVIVIDPERIAILCADVSGKGFPAALMASELQAYVRASLRAACVFADTSLGPLPVQVVALVNSQLSRHLGSGRYATMFFAEYDAADRSLRYVNAGQNPPLLLSRLHGSVAELTVGGPPVGLFEHASYDVETVTLAEDGVVLIYTDGVVEARNLDDEEFGLARLIEASTSRHRSVDRLLEHVSERLRVWSADVEQGDDITMLALAAEDTPNG
jgi:sigma-B regulation protein RsbU (phosphoserine phosphatase)